MSASKSTRSAGNKASALLRVGETALVVRTDGLNLELDGLRPFTAWWKISEARRFDRVIVYLARLGHNEAEAYCGTGQP